jgi:DNA-binding IclR family transcriptional regulator
MDRQQKESNANIILTMLRSNPQLNVNDVAARLKINKDKARRLLKWMISEGYIVKRTIRFGYNVKMNVYSRNI